MIEELSGAMENAKKDKSSVGVISMDLDRFKNIKMTPK